MWCRRISFYGFCFSFVLYCNLCSKNVFCKVGNYVFGGGGGDVGF